MLHKWVCCVSYSIYNIVFYIYTRDYFVYDTLGIMECVLPKGLFSAWYTRNCDKHITMCQNTFIIIGMSATSNLKCRATTMHLPSLDNWRSFTVRQVPKHQRPSCCSKDNHKGFLLCCGQTRQRSYLTNLLAQTEILPRILTRNRIIAMNSFPFIHCLH